MHLIEDEALQPIVIRHDLCDLQERGSNDSLNPIDAALCTGFADLGGRGNLCCSLAIADELHCRICAREVLSRADDGIPRNHAVDVSQFDFTAEPLAFHHCELVPLFVPAKELAGFALAYLKSPAVTAHGQALAIKAERPRAVRGELWAPISIAEFVVFVEVYKLFNRDFAIEEVFRQINAGDRGQEVGEVFMHALFPAPPRMRAAFALDSEADAAALTFTARAYACHFVAPLVIDGRGEFVIVTTWAIHADHVAQQICEQMGEPPGQVLIVCIAGNASGCRDVFALDGEPEVVGNDAVLSLCV